MWFGHGTAPAKAKPAAPGRPASGTAGVDQVSALATDAIAARPALLRVRAEAQYQGGTLPRLKTAMAAWIKAAHLDQRTFAGRLFGRAADDPVARTLHEAALAAAAATSQGGIRDAAGKLAGAIQAVGLDRWPGFVADAAERARDPATQAAIARGRQPPDPAHDGIRPVYPVETALGIGAAGVAGGAGAAARAVGGAIARQVLPEVPPVTSGAPAEGAAAAEKPANAGGAAPNRTQPAASAAPAEAKKPPISRQKQDGHIAGTPQNRNRLKLRKGTSVFDGSRAEADALTREAWQKGTPDPERSDIREYDFGRRIGTGGHGGGQSRVRVHQDSAGRIHGHPVGPETP